MLKKVFIQGSKAATQINRNVRKAIFPQITPTIAENDSTNYSEAKAKQTGVTYGAVPKVKENVFL
ncbi:hypothetical protein [Caldithrix abyssi]